LEETLSALIRAEFVSLLTDLEEERREYRRRLILKEESQAVLNKAETQVHELYSERIALGKRFWEAYYGDGELSFSEYKTDSGTLERVIERAEKELEKARANFETANFDESIEGSRLRAKADAAQYEAERRIAELEEALEDVLARARSSTEESSRSLRDELEAPRLDAAAKELTVFEENVETHQIVDDMLGGATMFPAAKSRRAWWLKWLSI
jgi:multidrug efflux pump subunit AcrA (membrane-fusion protein)